MYTLFLQERSRTLVCTVVTAAFFKSRAAQKVAYRIAGGRFPDNEHKGSWFDSAGNQVIRFDFGHERIKLGQEFDLFSYMPQFYPFVTKIKADYLISSRIEPTAFVFIIRESPSGNAVCDFLCCSAFEESGRDYRANQRSRTLLKKERVHIKTQDTVVLYDRLPKNLD